MSPGILTVAWIAASVSLLGCCGIGLLASGVQDRDGRVIGWGAAFFGLAILGIPLVR